MAEVLLKVVFGVLIFSLGILAFTTIASDTADNMGVGLGDTTAFNESMNKINETVNLTRELNSQMFDTGQDTGSTSEDSLIKGSFSSLKIVWRSFDLAKSLMQNLAVAFKIPVEFVAVFATMLLMAIGFGILLLVFRRT